MDGITYEEKSLNEHFLKVGFFDPITRRDLDFQRIIENKNLIAAFEYFIDKNPWAFDLLEKEEKKNNFLSLEI